MQTQVVAKGQLRTDLGLLFQNKRFLRLLISHSMQGIVFMAFIMTEQWYVVNELKQSEWLGVVMMATAFPRLIFMVVGGVLTDRFSGASLLISSSVMRALLLFVATGLFLSGHLILWVILCFAVLFGILDAFSMPAGGSITPFLVPKELLQRVNALMRMFFQVSMMLGTVVAAMVISVSSFTGSFLMIAALLLISSALTYSLNIPLRKNFSETQKKSVLRDTKEGFTYVSSRKTILSFLLVLLMTNFFFIGPIGISIPLIVSDILHGDALTLSLYHSAWAGGLMLGSLAALLFNLKKKRLFRSTLLLMVQGLLLVGLGQVDIIWVHLLSIVIMASCASMVSVPIFSYVQENTDKEMLGRVMSLLNITSLGILPLSYALASFTLSAGISTALLLLFSGVILISFCIVVLSTNKGIQQAD